MILERRETDAGVEFVSPDGEYRLSGIHKETADCHAYGCVVHSPSTWALSDAPLNWRTDRGIFERICEHGIGHPDLDSADWLIRHGRESEAIHGCDGCC
jgi:hypothetical protein